MKKHRIRLPAIKLRSLMTVLILVSFILNGCIYAILSRYFINRAFEDYTSNKLRIISYMLASIVRNNSTDDEKFSWLLETIEQTAFANGVFICLRDEENRILVDTIKSGDNYDKAKGNFLETKIYTDKGFFGTLTVSSQNHEGLLPGQVQTFYNRVGRSAGIIWIAGLAVSLAILVMMFKLIADPVADLSRRVSSIKYLKKRKLKSRSNITELRILTENFNYMIDIFRSKEKWRQSLLDDISHELRTPLSITSMQLEAISDGVVEFSSSSINTIKQEVVRLIRLITGIQELSMASGSKFELKYGKHDAYSIVKKVIDSFTPVCKERNITIKYNYICRPMDIYCDADKLTQAIYNIMSNAVKYSYDNSVIEVNLTEKSGYYYIQVKDYGVGIPEECIPYLFDRFYRVDPSRSIKTGGNGLGLCIAKSLVEAHKGSIKVQSVYHAGSTFTIAVPAEI